MHVTEAISVARPREEVYAFWRDFENLPRFMRNLESVVTTSLGRSHWAARLVTGILVEWDAELVEDRLNERIAWRTVGADDDIRHAGAVTFAPLGAHSTEVQVDLMYDAPGGKLGSTIARLFGDDPGRQISEDLARFKRVLEVGPTRDSRSRGSFVDR